MLKCDCVPKKDKLSENRVFSNIWIHVQTEPHVTGVTANHEDEYGFKKFLFLSLNKLLLTQNRM